MNCQSCGETLIMVMDEAMGRTVACKKCDVQWDINWHHREGVD